MNGKKLFTVEQIRAWDAYTIRNEPVSSIHLMERASIACSVCITSCYKQYRSFIVFCGSGNNGGDGLAISRLLADKGLDVTTVCVPTGSALSPDNHTNLVRLQQQGKARIIQTEGEPEIPAVVRPYVIIDAILGSGLTRTPDQKLTEWIRLINNTGAPVIAVDLPSGLHGDTGRMKGGEVIKADVTLTFQVPKIAFMFPDTEQYTGRVEVLDIGLHPAFCEQEKEFAIILTKQMIGGLMQNKRPVFAHKGTYGHAWIAAGSKGKAGAAIMSVSAALKSGCGLVTLRTVASCLYPVQTLCPEAMVDPDDDENFLSAGFSPEGMNALGIGPGIGQSARTARVLEQLMQHHSVPKVLDADALNLLAANPGWLKLLNEQTILTPHVGEFHRLAGTFEDGRSRYDAMRDFAMHNRCLVVLKGAHTCIASHEGKTYFNSTGNPGMAKGGSGDVLTGLITGLLARGSKPLDAALTGVFIHGLAGDLAAAEVGQEGMTAMDIVRKIPEAIRITSDTTI